MIFEILPVEIIREFFEYLNGFDIYQSFYGLNRRLTAIVLSTMESHIDLREVMSNEYIQMLHLVNPSHVISLKLANRWERNQINSVIRIYSIDTFTQVRSLTFDLLSITNLEEIVDILPSLTSLVSLTITSNENPPSKIYSKLFYRLRHIKRLRLMSLKGKLACWGNIDIRQWHLDTSLLFPYLPHLRSIETSLCFGNAPIPYLPRLRSCILYFGFYGFPELSDFFRQCPNLKILKLETTGIDVVDGQQWENILTRALSRLQHFNLLVEFMGDYDVESCRASFQTQFWIQRATQVNLVESHMHIAPDDIRTVYQMTIDFNYQNQHQSYN
ncbi:unnamed protein product [Adineta ricciae]|uniref:F-box domain-containing protein n=1 Tax=Adineta ricciae TaxID=249248 RepID=A0A814W3F9_ADIRI|nr:unnamed protein product [Adineta ricciae]